MMKGLTDNQRRFLTRRKIKVGQAYSFPSWGFTIYPDASLRNGEYIDTNIFTKSLEHHQFQVKSKEGNFYRGNFERSPSNPDFYLTESQLSMQPLSVMLFLLLLFTLPFLIYNNLKAVLQKQK